MSPARADAAFKRYVERLWPRAKKRGISRATFDAAFKDVGPDPEIWEKDANQPEFVMPASQYISLAVSDTRIEEGSKKLEIHADLLEKIENKYKVDRQVLVAIWGMETSYGTYMGKKYVIQALATLGYKGRRTKFGRKQLMSALKILEQGHTTPERMEGSWAGAMGHTQFIPTTYTGNAVDFDGDGRRDIWDTLPDALASTANYLKKSGWQYGKTWGYEVVLPKRFNTRLAGLKRRSSLAQWRKLGVKAGERRAVPEAQRPGLALSAGRPEGSGVSGAEEFPGDHALQRSHQICAGRGTSFRPNSGLSGVFDALARWRASAGRGRAPRIAGIAARQGL